MVKNIGQQLEPVIGLEIHLQLKTKSKMFCRCQNEWLEESPNVNICPICLGQPGVLPVLNQEAINMAIKLGLALNGKVANISRFDRKNYFYPDLPKGYQISQYNLPIIQKASLPLETRKINITRIHLEEDTAKLIHTPDKKWSLLDFNRAGVPLVEIVTEPDIKSPQEAKLFLRELQLIARYLDISWADMEKGQMRCDVNISLKKVNQSKLYKKTEIKNLNSFKAVEESLEYEIKKQTLLWQKHQIPNQQLTCGWDEKKKQTYEQRSKEENLDYRYFPEPDLPPLFLKNFDLDKIKKDLPELPQAKRERYIKRYGFSQTETRVLTDDKYLASFAERVITELKAWLVSLQTVDGVEQEIWGKHKVRFIKLVGSWLVNRLIYLMNENKVKAEDLKITPENFAEFIILLYENKISSTLGQQILEKMFFGGTDVDRVISKEGLKVMDNQGELEKVIQQVLIKNQNAVNDYKSGKVNAMVFLIGQVMRETKGRADVEIIRAILERKL